MKPTSATATGYKSYSSTGWTGHGRGIDLSAEYARMASGFIVNNPEVFKETAKDFFRDFPELYDFGPGGAMEQAAYVLYHICKQEVPDIYETIITLRKKLLSDDRLTSVRAQINTKLTMLLSNAKEAKDFFEKVKRAVPRCSWNRESLENVIHDLICNELDAIRKSSRPYLD